MSLTDRLIARVTDEMRARAPLLDQSAGGSVQVTTQLDLSGRVKSVKISIQLPMLDVIPK